MEFMLDTYKRPKQSIEYHRPKESKAEYLVKGTELGLYQEKWV